MAKPIARNVDSDLVPVMIGVVVDLIRKAIGRCLKGFQQGGADVHQVSPVQRAPAEMIGERDGQSGMGKAYRQRIRRCVALRDPPVYWPKLIESVVQRGGVKTGEGSQQRARDPAGEDRQRPEEVLDGGARARLGQGSQQGPQSTVDIGLNRPLWRLVVRHRLPLAKCRGPGLVQGCGPGSDGSLHLLQNQVDEQGHAF